MQEIEIDIVEVMAKEFNLSKSEVSRVIDQGGLKAYQDGEWVDPFQSGLELPVVLRLGKKKFIKLI